MLVMAQSRITLLADRSLHNIDVIACALESGLSDVAEFIPQECKDATIAIAIGVPTRGIHGIVLIHIPVTIVVGFSSNSLKIACC